MKKAGLFLVVLMAFIPELYAQDILVLKSKKRIEAKVMEIGLNEVKYRKFSNLDGPVYNIAKADVFLIMYENGTQESFEETETPAINTKPNSSTQYNTDMLVPTNTYKLSSSDKSKLRTNDINIYNDYNSARTSKAIIGVVGGVSTLIVIGTVAVGLINFDKNDTSASNNFNFGPGFYVAAGVSLVAGLISKGPKRKIKESLINHNESVKRRINEQSFLDFGRSKSGGVGLVYNF